jgi:hypothetical protein
MSGIPLPMRVRRAPLVTRRATTATVLLGDTHAARRPAARRCAVGLVVALLSTINARASEICHFAGTTHYSGRLEVTTNVNSRVTDGTTTVDVITRFIATPWPLIHIHYLMEEISAWKSDQLQSVAASTGVR